MKYSSLRGVHTQHVLAHYEDTANINPLVWATDWSTLVSQVSLPDIDTTYKRDILPVSSGPAKPPLA